MKKLSTYYLFLILFSFSAPSFADDISEYQIEGISIGDSLLDHLSKEEIITEIEINKPAYNYLTEDFGEVYLFSNFDIYDNLSFMVKPKDKHYTIYAIKYRLSIRRPSYRTPLNKLFTLILLTFFIFNSRH